jgi:glutamine amidotransferase
MISIIDYNMGNVGSIANMIKKIGGQSVVTNDWKAIDSASGIILPGVGSFDEGIRNLRKHDLLQYLKDTLHEKNVPVLGICLGMQLLTNGSEEGTEQGLGIIQGGAFRFPDDNNIKVPHMGWNSVEAKKHSALFEGFNDTPRFYFVHSYYVLCNNEPDVLGVTTYGKDFHSAFERQNVSGVQYHPEKSHKFGMTLLQGFLNKVKNA